MKLGKFLIIICLTAIFLPSCELLDRTSPNDIDADDAFTTAESAENALVGVYNSMQAREYYGGVFPMIGDAVTDDIFVGGFDDPSLDELGFNQVTTQNVHVEEVWLAIYRTIANANYLLEGLQEIDPSEFEDGQRESIEGQARALRAWGHFDALRLYGEHWNGQSFFGVPIVSSVQTIEQVALRGSVQESYNFIISELEEAAKFVSSERTPGYVDLLTVQAMLAKVNLFKKDFAQAESYASQVIDSGEFGLYDASEIGNIYTDRQTQESIFELAFDNQNRSAYNTLTYSRPDALNTELWFMSDVALGDFFASRPGDARSTLHDFDPEHNDVTIQPNGRTEKYRGEVLRDNSAYILRLAEMYLIRAEAKGLAGLDDLNFLRQARGLQPVNPATEEEYLAAILDERRAELNFEGSRLFDLARFGKFVEVLGLEQEEGYRAILPIPLREVNATNGELIQNPGY
ncbi:MAG: RagB/SusD family nutrient uptake outer membrane protein [Bacteroidota bacterium]